MKIPTNPTGPGPIPPEGPLDKGGPGRNTAAAKTPFAAPRPGESAHASPASRLSLPGGWQRAGLDTPDSLDAMLRECVNQLVASSPIAGQLNDAQRARLEQHLAGDPVTRELLTQHLERSLV